MAMHYDMNWLRERFDAGERLKFLYFWGHTNRYNEEVGKFCFSQWFESPFIVDTIHYKTAEHWMMAQKALLLGDNDSFSRIIDCDTPDEAKKLGREVTGYIEEVWDEQKFEIVKQGNIFKFSQHPKLGDYLIGTGDKIIVEASPVDAIWGIGMSQSSDHIDNVHSWRGQNLLGFALMEVRDFLREKAGV